MRRRLKLPEHLSRHVPPHAHFVRVCGGGDYAGDYVVSNCRLTLTSFAYAAAMAGSATRDHPTPPHAHFVRVCGGNCAADGPALHLRRLTLTSFAYAAATTRP